MNIKNISKRLILFMLVCTLSLTLTPTYTEASFSEVASFAVSLALQTTEGAVVGTLTAGTAIYVISLLLLDSPIVGGRNGMPELFQLLALSGGIGGAAVGALFNIIH